MSADGDVGVRISDLIGVTDAHMDEHLEFAVIQDLVVELLYHLGFHGGRCPHDWIIRQMSKSNHTEANPEPSGHST